MGKYELLNGWFLPSAIAVCVGEISANPDKYKYINSAKLLELCEMYARETTVCKNCGKLNHIREYCSCIGEGLPPHKVNKEE